MPDAPKVSIIIPVYNAERDLEQCLSNALEQSERAIEVIAIDDGSTDGSAEILEKSQNLDSRVVVLSQENAGSGRARNAGLKAANGRFVAFLDSDDWYPDRETLAKLYRAADANGALICGGSFCRITEDGFQTQFSGNMAGYAFAAEGMIEYRDYQFDHGYHRFLYDRAMLLENGVSFPEYRRYQDPPFFVNAMIAAGQFYAIPDVVYCYRAEYSAIQWNQVKTLDLAKGLREVYTQARAHQLDELAKLTISRINGDYAGILLDGLRGGDRELLGILTKINADFDGLLEPLSRMLDALSGSIASDVYEELARAKGELQTVQNSLSYRTAKALLKIPSALKQLALRRRFTRE